MIYIYIHTHILLSFFLLGGPVTDACARALGSGLGLLGRSGCLGFSGLGVLGFGVLGSRVFRGLGSRDGPKSAKHAPVPCTWNTRFPSSTLLPFFFSGSLNKTKE